MANHDKRRESDTKAASANTETIAPPPTPGAPIVMASANPVPPGVPISKPRAILWSVKVRDGELTVGASPTNEVQPLAPANGQGWDIVVCGPSVLLVPPAAHPTAHAAVRGSGGNGSSPAFAELASAHGMPDGAQRGMRIAHELPRSACTIRWLVPADATAEQLGEMVFGRGFAAVTASPDAKVVEFRRDKTARAAVEQSARKKAPPPAPVEDEDDGFAGSGPEGEA